MNNMTNQLLLNACKVVLDGFDKGVFVRNTALDDASDWAIKLFPYLKALGDIQAITDECKTNGDQR